MRKISTIFLFFALLALPQVFASAEAAIIVGRVAHIEGTLQRYIEETDELVETFVDSPVGTKDVLVTENNSRAELIFPNRMVLRLDENSTADIIGLDDDSATFYVQGGPARATNNSADSTLYIETSQGTIRIPAGSSADLQADKRSLQVSAVVGKSTFMPNDAAGEQERYEVISGSTTLEISGQRVTASRGPLDRAWDRWCDERENFWQEKRAVRSEHLPDSLQEHAYALEPRGHWRKIYYRGFYYWGWQPNFVAVGWEPYTVGRWVDWSGDRVWVSDEPWGWATYHHGHWVRQDNSWWWTPYIHIEATPGVTAIGFSLSFGNMFRPAWHPGRVRWISSPEYIGWLPLSPWETYYGSRRWDNRTVVMLGGPNFSININLGSHQYIDQAIIIPRNRFYPTTVHEINNYNTVRITNINKTVIINNYQAIPTLDRTEFNAKGDREAIAGKNNGRHAKQSDRDMEKITAIKEMPSRTESRKSLRDQADSGRDAKTSAARQRGDSQTVDRAVGGSEGTSSPVGRRDSDMQDAKHRSEKTESNSKAMTRDLLDRESRTKAERQADKRKSTKEPAVVEEPPEQPSGRTVTDRKERATRETRTVEPQQTEIPSTRFAMPATEKEDSPAGRQQEKATTRNPLDRESRTKAERQADKRKSTKEPAVVEEPPEQPSGRTVTDRKERATRETRTVEPQQTEIPSTRFAMPATEKEDSPAGRQQDTEMKQKSNARDEERKAAEKRSQAWERRETGHEETVTRQADEPQAAPTFSKSRNRQIADRTAPVAGPAEDKSVRQPAREQAAPEAESQSSGKTDKATEENNPKKQRRNKRQLKDQELQEDQPEEPEKSR